MKRFIKSDSEVTIGSEGLIGDRLLIITQGSSESEIASEGEEHFSNEPVETDAIMASLEITAANAEVITFQLAEIMIKVNSGEGTLGRLIQDTTFAENLNQTMVNLKSSSESLDENMEAVKHNIFFKGYFNKKAKEAEKKKKQAAQKEKDKKK